MLTVRITALALAAVLCTSAATIPRKAPNFTVKMNNGKPLQLSEYKGKVVVLAFILTTCSHCQAATRILNKLQAEMGPRGLQVIESAIDENAQALVPGFVRN